MSKKCRAAISIINIWCIAGGFVGIIIGSTIIPQTVSNEGNRYIGSADEYNTDLRNSQLNSYGFKVTMISLGITLANCISLALACCYMVDTDPTQRRVTIHPTPTIIEIPNNDMINENRIKNIKKWLGDTVIPDERI
jgi:hypothetical protein